MNLKAVCIGIFVCASQNPAIADNDSDIDELYWLAGEWIGEGREGDDGEIEGVARLYWTPPLEGSISLFFTWHAADSNHVHYALNVFQKTSDGIHGKGIHYGPDFENFEENPWHLKATQVGRNRVSFECLEHCRSLSVSFTQLENGVLEERWKLNPEEKKPDWIVLYQRAD